MNLKLEMFGALCEPRVFDINDKRADYSDFGHKSDHAPEDAEPYCCGDMRFESKAPTQAVLDKYGITLDEYDEVCKILEENLSWGSCGWCS